MPISGSRSQPLAASLPVQQGRDLYLAENGFTVAEYDHPRTPASIFGLRFSVPNTPKHRWAIMLHDLHHVATGYGTDLAGEGEISAWELRSGLGSLGLYVGSIVLGGALFGFMFAPRRVLQAFLQGGRKPALFDRPDLSYDTLMRMSVAELRAELAIPPNGLAQVPRELHSHAPLSVEQARAEVL
jgi:hypothetical protein